MAFFCRNYYIKVVQRLCGCFPQRGAGCINNVFAIGLKAELAACEERLVNSKSADALSRNEEQGPLG